MALDSGFNLNPQNITTTLLYGLRDSIVGWKSSNLRVVYYPFTTIHSVKSPVLVQPACWMDFQWKTLYSAMHVRLNSRHRTLKQCWVNVGPAS